MATATEWISLRELADLIGVQYMTVYHALWDGRIQVGSRVGGHRLFTLDDVAKVRAYFVGTGKLKKAGGK